MKRFLFMLILVSVHCICNAQRLNFGPEAGYVYNGLSVDQYKSFGRSGFKAGGILELTLRKSISLESGISFVRKGGGIYGASLSGTEVSRIEFSVMDYLQIPIMAGYRFNIGNQFSVKPEIGAYYAVGIGGHSFITGIDSWGQPYEARVSTFSTGYDRPYRPCNRNDAGVTMGVEFTYKHLGLRFNYDAALTNAIYYGNGTHRTFSVSAIYWVKQ